MDIEIYALAHSKSYGHAMLLGENAPSSSNTLACAEALASHYLDKMTSYIYGYETTLTLSNAVPSVLAHLESLERHGLGIDIGLKKREIRVVSETSAMCFLTWEMSPKNGNEKFSVSVECLIAKTWLGIFAVHSTNCSIVDKYVWV